MRNTKPILVASVSLLLAAFAGCSSSPSGGSGGGTSAGTTATGKASTTATGKATGTTTTTGVGGAGGAKTISSTSAVSTVTGAGGAGGTSDVGMQCNPVTGAPCAITQGETCDFDGQQGFYACFGPPNTAMLCKACDFSNGPFCGPGLTCVGGTVVPMACSVPAKPPSMGTCYNPNGSGGAGGAGTGGAGVGGAATVGVSTGAGGAGGAVTATSTTTGAGGAGGASTGVTGAGGAVSVSSSTGAGTGGAGGASTTGFCAAYCCTSADCGGGTCDLAAGSFGVGICK